MAEWLSSLAGAWRRRSWQEKFERIALGFLWLMLFVVLFNFGHFPVGEFQGRYYDKTFGWISAERALPYLIVEYAFWVACGTYAVSRLALWLYERRKKLLSGNHSDA